MTEIVIEEKRPVGRPKLPENIIKELQEKIITLENERKKEDAESNFEELKQLAEIIRIVQRAVKGLDPNEDTFQGLINIKDIRERTRLDKPDLLSHSAMRIAATNWPEFKLFENIADMEDPYFISEDGQGRLEGILLQQAKTKTDANLVLNMPNTNGGPAQNPTDQPTQPPKKKHFWNKVPGLNH